MSQSVYVLSNGRTPQEDLVIAALRTVPDPDGISSTPNYTFAWERSAERTDSPAAWQRISTATASTYTPSDADVGFFIRAVLGYVDGANNTETVVVATEEVVANVNDRPTHNLRLVGNFTENGVVTVGVQAGVTQPPRILDADHPTPITLEGLRFSWYADNVALSAEGSSLVLTQDEVGKRIEVRLAYTDARGTDESISIAASALITNINDSPTGVVEIEGTPSQGSVLTVTNTLDDADGMPVGANAFTYAWFANGSAISGATQPSLVLTQGQVGKLITVRATYTDRFGTVETRESAPTPAVENVNDAPVGNVRLEGVSQPGSATTTAREDSALRAVNAFTDADGLPASFNIRWQMAGTPNSVSDWVDIEGQRGASAQFTPGDGEVGQYLRVLVRYTDTLQTEEEVPSAPLGPVLNVNDSAVGLVKVVGVPKQGETLSLNVEVTDNDGPAQVEEGRLSYQWIAGNADIAEATGSTFTPTQAHVGAVIRARVSFNDERGGRESLTSGPTAAVENEQDQPDGMVRVLGTARQGQVLSVDHSQLVDPDGPKSNIVISWLADGQPLGINGGQLTLTQALADKRISVSMSYSDGYRQEVVLSDETAPVQDVQDAPTGTVSLSGQALEKSTLTATAQIGDLDGVGDVSWEWLANGQLITGAGASTLDLTQDLVGARIVARASYRDGLGRSEFVSSAESAVVGNVNDPLEGGVSIEGGLEQGRTLSLRHDITDLDGIPRPGQPGALSFQWLSNGAPIAGANGLSFVPGQAQVGKTIGVRASYKDLGGKDESVVVSAAEIDNVNDAPVSSLRLEGLPLVGASLKRAGSFADPDGISAQAKAQWLVGGVALDSADGDQLKLDGSMAGKSVALQLSYTDAFGADESVSVNVAKVDYAKVAGSVYHWRSHVLMPGVEVLLDGLGQPSGSAGQGGTGASLGGGFATGAFVPPAAGLAAAAASGLALRGVGFDQEGDLLAEVWLDPGVFVNQVSARFVVSGRGGVEFTPMSGALPDSWSPLSAISRPAGGGELVLETSTPDTLESVKEPVLLGTLQVDLTAAGNWARIALEQAELGGSDVSPYAVTLGRAVSGSQGTYSFGELDFEAFGVQAHRPLSGNDVAEARAAITSADALAALKLVSGRNVNAATDGSGSGTNLPPGVSPYQLVAADVNRDGQVTADDARLIMAMATGRPGAPTPEWVLIREDQGYALADGAPGRFELTRQQAGFEPDGVLVPGGKERGGLVAVLLGDVNGSWRPLDGSGNPVANSPVLAADYLSQLNVDLGVPLGQFGLG